MQAPPAGTGRHNSHAGALMTAVLVSWDSCNFEDKLEMITESLGLDGHEMEDNTLFKSERGGLAAINRL